MKLFLDYDNPENDYPSLYLWDNRFLYYPLFIYLFHSWLTNPFYSHGILIPVFSLIIGIWIYKKNKPSIDITLTSEKNGDISYEGVILLCCAMVLLVSGIILSSFLVQGLSLILTIYSVIVLLFHQETALLFLFPVCFLIFMVPIPGIEYYATTLASYSATISRHVIQLFGYQISQTGAEIQIINSSFTVGVPCSGLKTIISLLVPASILIYFLDCKFLIKIAFFIITIPIAVLSNITRITLIIYIALRFGEAAARGFYHTFYGLLMPIIAFFLLITIIILTRQMKFRPLR